VLHRDSNTGVCHGKANGEFVLLPTLKFSFQRDLATVGELDRITHQVQADLSQQARVTSHHLWQGGCDVTKQFQPLFAGAQGEHL
jgi:hypothetical protein